MISDRLPRAVGALSFILVIATLGAGMAGCKSFDESVRPIITPQPPPGYKPPVYVSGTTPVSAVDPSSLSLEVWRVNSEPYPDSVQLYVRVFDDDHHLVTGLAPPYYKGADDYRTVWNGVSEQLGVGGSRQSIDDYTVREFSDQDGIPYEISLVLDYSGTMESSVGGLEDAASAFVSLKRPQDRIAVVKFDTRPELEAAPTTSTPDLISHIRSGGLGSYGGYTALYAAVKMGGEQVASAPSGHPRALVVFTDGEDNASTIAVSQLYDYVRQNDIPIFTIAFGAINSEVLSELSQRSGGRFYQTYSTEELRAAFEDIYTSLRNYYLVTYKPPFVVGEHEASVRLNPPKAAASISGTGSYVVTEGRGAPDYAAPPVALDTIYFMYNLAELGQQAQPVIDLMAKQLKENPRLKIEVQGHTDSKGGEEYNLGLSDRRAEVVRDALLAEGIDSNRVRARGYGLTRPAASNETEAGRALNRRATFVVIAR